VNIPENIPLTELSDPVLSDNGVRLFVKRDDLIHPHISGNKWRKLRYNLEKAREEGKDTILTFGGAFSNHIAAVAFSGKEFGFKTIGIIRGEPVFPLNPTLELAAKCGMVLHFLDRESYRMKQSPELIGVLRQRFGDVYLLPEGGANEQGVRGCEEILSEVSIPFDVVCCSCGTGTTMAGIVRNLHGTGKQAIGFPALKGGEFLYQDIRAMSGASSADWELCCDYHFGGYAKVTPVLMEFIDRFEKDQGIPLEPVYTGKMFFGIFDKVRKGHFPPGTVIIAVHTGGLQGNRGFGRG
jgi:1-aminocyclopropane-1-carboxylate deaminase